MKSISRREREKKTKEDEILLSAERIFSSKGYNDASMDEIAKEAQFTKRTVYQYFKTKEDLYLSVVTKSFQILLKFITEEVNADKSGFEQMEGLFMRFYLYYKAYPQSFSIMSKWGDTKNKIITENNVDLELLKVNQSILESIKQSIENGKADGSVVSTRDTHELALSLMFLITAFYNQLSISGESFTKHYELDLEAFRLSISDILLSVLKK